MRRLFLPLFLVLLWLAYESMADAATPCVKHAFVSQKADGGDNTQVRPSDWNACHDVEDGAITEAKLATPWKAWLPAAACVGTSAAPVWDLPSTNPAVAVCTIGGTNGVIQGTLDFADGANTLSAQMNFQLPAGHTTVSANIKWFSATTSGSVVWQLQTSCVADSETNDPTWNTANTVTDAAKGTANQTNDASIASVTLTGCAAGELFHLRILRDPTHASDDHGGTARLIGVTLAGVSP